jgi:hypothetical protein
MVIIGLNVVFSLTFPGISLLGHLGGLVVGTGVAAGMAYGPARSRPVVGLWIAAGVVVALVAAVALRDLSFGSVVCQGTTCRVGG